MPPALSSYQNMRNNQQNNARKVQNSLSLLFCRQAIDTVRDFGYNEKTANHLPGMMKAERYRKEYLMNIYAALVLFSIIILVYWIITEWFTILFRFTGLPDEKARFQVISLLTGCGYTTRESEMFLSSRRWRRKSAQQQPESCRNTTSRSASREWKTIQRPS